MKKTKLKQVPAATSASGEDRAITTKTTLQPSKSTTTTTTTTTTTMSTTNKDTAVVVPVVAWESLSEWNETSMAQVANWWNLSAHEVNQLWQLRDRLIDVNHWKNQPNEVVWFLLDAHGHLTKAELKFRRMIQWRLQHDVDDIIDHYQPPHPSMAEYIPTTVLEGCDKQGDPIWVERVGAADSWGLFKTFGHQALIRYAVYIRELCIRGEWARDYQRKHIDGRPPMRATAIIDMQDMSWDHCKPSLLPLAKEGLHIIQNYYCGFGKKVIVIRVSKLFFVVWKVAQHVCGANLKNMMIFATADNYLEVLEQYVDLEHLPPCIYPQGGKGKAGMGMPTNLEGGKVPSFQEMDALWAKKLEEHESDIPAAVAQKARSVSGCTSGLSDGDDESNRVFSASGDVSPKTIDYTMSSCSSSSKAVPSHRFNNERDPNEWSEANFQKTMALWNVTPQEEDQVRTLQRRLVDVNHWKNIPVNMIRFLRDCHHKIDLSENRFRTTIQWRLEHHVDIMLETYRPYKLMLDYFFITMLRPDTCCDNDGDPIYIERPGITDAWSIYQRFGRQAMLDYLTWIREEASRGAFAKAYINHHGHPPKQITAVVDLYGLNTRHMKPGLLPLFRDVMRVAQDHYCGMAKRIFVIRAPKIFKVIWAIVHPFLDDKLKHMIVFASSTDYLDVMSEYMDIHVLPPCIYEHGHGEGGVGLPKRLDGGELPPETDHDHILATPDDIDPPGYSVDSSGGGDGDKPKSPQHVNTHAVRLGGGSFEFSNGHEPGGDLQPALTVTALVE